MTTTGSVSLLLRRLPQKEQTTFQKLWDAYYLRLVRLARRNLRSLPRAGEDEEDLALSAFNSFFRCAVEGRFPQLADRDDLWQVLVRVTRCKALNLLKHESRQKRGGGRVVSESALPAEDEGRAFAEMIGREPDPAFAAQVAEECQRLLELLQDSNLRQVAVMKMEGHTNHEIADKVGRSVPTVELRLRRIRKLWEKEVGP
jgi:DNA-directed RNA polymerase specialized sigma24 family protein